jgi:hypothetical protein
MSQTLGDPIRDITMRAKWVRKWKDIYTQNGGPVAACIDAYVRITLTNGYKFVCEEAQDELQDKVQAWADQSHVDLDSIMAQGIVDALVCGTAFQEIVPTSYPKIAEFPIWGVIPRDAASFWIDYDAYGRIIGYQQMIAEKGVVQRLMPIPQEESDRILTLTLFPIPGEVYGISLIGRAYDDIMRDCDMVESLTKAMHRHGTPKQQWDIGSPENPATEADLDNVGDRIEEIASDTDFVTTNTRIQMLDTTGITGADVFSNLTLQRLAAAMGVPEEVIGLGRGSTEATANVRLKAFYDTISAIQEIVARTYSRRVIDQITGVPGAVWIEFNDPNPADEKQKAEWIALLRQGMDPDAICPADWCREQFGIPPDKDSEKMQAPMKGEDDATDT